MIDRRVLFFGDSHVAGVGDPTGQGWVGRIVTTSFGLGLPLTAYNLGVRMETSEQVAARWRAETLPRLLPGADCRVVLSFGVNDTTIEGVGPRVASERSCAALAAMLDGIAALDLRALVVGPAPVGDREQNARIGSLSDSFSEVCRRAGVKFVDVFEPLLTSHVWITEVAAYDGAHPAADGYDTLANVVVSAGWGHWPRAETG